MFNINLKTHERTHTRGNPYSCSQCNYKCSTSRVWKNIACGRFGNKVFKWHNSNCWQHIAGNNNNWRAKDSGVSIWSARQAVDCQVSEAYLASKICVILHAFSDQNVILCGYEQLNGFHFGLDFHVSLDQQDLRILSFIKSSWMVFHFCADFHVSLDQ